MFSGFQINDLLILLLTVSSLYISSTVGSPSSAGRRFTKITQEKHQLRQ